MFPLSEEVGFVWSPVTNPSKFILKTSLPAVSNEIVSAAGNLIFVSVSPEWIILSGIVKVLLHTKPWTAVIVPSEAIVNLLPVFVSSYMLKTPCEP